MQVKSFQIDHTKLNPGVYLSDIAPIGREDVSVYDVRIIKPTSSERLDPPAVHTLEHLLAHYLRDEDSEFKDSVIYIGPMGCLTGFYLILDRVVEPIDVGREIIRPAFIKVANHTGDIPGNSEVECGSPNLHDLEQAKKVASKYLSDILDNLSEANTVYPETMSC